VRRTRAYVGLGVNVGDAQGTLEGAVAALAALPGARLAGVSRLYRTRPVGLTDQPAFHNAVAALDVPTGPDPPTGASALLVALKAIERAFGRRERERWGPRELDLDLLVFGRHRIRLARPPAAAPGNTEVRQRWLEVPHPEARRRLFVLAPMADLAPGLRPPGWRESVESARDRRERVEGPDAVAPVGRWDDAARRWD
jgi:2-amino-4-hydroxy-6-hydroxymethyldihydropteridine diphosphokinase